MFNIYMVHVTFKLNQGENIAKLCVFSLWPQFYELSVVIKKTTRYLCCLDVTNRHPL